MNVRARSVSEGLPSFAYASGSDELERSYGASPCGLARLFWLGYQKMEPGNPLALGGAQADRPLLLRGWEGPLESDRRGRCSERFSLSLATILYAGKRWKVRKGSERKTGRENRGAGRWYAVGSCCGLIDLSRLPYLGLSLSLSLSAPVAGFAGDGVEPPQPIPTVTRNAPRTIAAISLFTVQPSFREDIPMWIPGVPYRPGLSCKPTLLRTET